MRSAIFVGLVLAAVLVAAVGVLAALYRKHARQEAWWRETRPSCRLLTVVSGKAFGPPRAIYEYPGGLLVKRNIGD